METTHHPNPIRQVTNPRNSIETQAIRLRLLVVIQPNAACLLGEIALGLAVPVSCDPAAVCRRMTLRRHCQFWQVAGFREIQHLSDGRSWPGSTIMNFHWVALQDSSRPGYRLSPNIDPCVANNSFRGPVVTFHHSGCSMLW